MSVPRTALRVASIFLLVAGVLSSSTPSRADDASSQSCGRNLIANGSFEHGVANVGNYLTVKAGSDDIDDWTVTKGTVDIVGALWAASDGTRSIDMDGVSFGAISQAFKTEKGKTYVVTFDFLGNGYGPPTVKRLHVSAGDKAADFSYDLAHRPLPNHGWVTRSFQFAAKSDMTTLSFESLDTESGYFGPVIDNVVVQATCAQ